MKNKKSFSLLPVILVLTAIIAGAGWFIDSIYAKELPFLSTKSRTNDLVLSLVVVPTGFVLYSCIRRKQLWARLFAFGLLMYLLFFIGFNVFNLQFNRLFLLYILVISISSYVFITEFPDLLRTVGRLEKLPHRRFISSVVLLIAVSGLGFWLSEVLPALISGGVPLSIRETNLPVNAASVFDLAFMLPLMIIGAVKLWKKETAGLVISVIMLSWLVLTCISVVSMEVGLKYAGLDFDFSTIISVAFNGTLGLILLWVIVKKAKLTRR